MTATVQYETADGVEVVERDDAHTDRDGYVVAYDNSNDSRPNVWIPDHRVISITKE